MIWKQKEIFNKLVDERLKEIIKLDQNVNPDHLIYKHKGSTADAKFDEFDNALNLLDKIREDEISLADAKNVQAEFKSNQSEIKKGTKNVDQKSNKTHCIILKCFAKQGVI